MEIQELSPILVGACIGYFTNWVAIKLLFWPQKPFFLIHGAIPKNKARLAASIGQVSSEHLISSEEITGLISEQFSQERFKSIASEMAPDMVALLDQPESKKVLVDLVTKNILMKISLSNLPIPQAMIQGFLKGVSDNISLAEFFHDRQEEIARLLADKLYPIISEKIEQLVAQTLTADRIASTVEERVNSLDVQQLEDIICEVTNRELIIIKWSGALLGTLIGIIQMSLLT